MDAKRLLRSLTGAGLAPWIVVIGAILPLPGANGTLGSFPSLCAFHNLTGRPCPGCGLTRAVVCLCHGRFAESLGYHPLALIVLAVIAVYPWLKNKPKMQNAMLVALAASLLLFWPLRLLGFVPVPGA